MAPRPLLKLLFGLSLTACSPAPKAEPPPPQALAPSEVEPDRKNGDPRPLKEVLDEVLDWLGSELGIEHRNQRMELVDGWLGATRAELDEILTGLREGELLTVCKARRSVAPGAEQRFNVLRRVKDRYHVWKVSALEHTSAARVAMELEPSSAKD